MTTPTLDQLSTRDLLRLSLRRGAVESFARQTLGHGHGLILCAEELQEWEALLCAQRDAHKLTGAPTDLLGLAHDRAAAAAAAYAAKVGK